MIIRTTRHAVERFRERIAVLSWPAVRDEIERQLGESVDLSGQRLRSLQRREEHLDYWINEQSGAVFVVDLSVSDEICVVSVLTEGMTDNFKQHPKGTNQKRAGKAPVYGHDFHRTYSRQKRIEDV